MFELTVIKNKKEYKISLERETPLEAALEALGLSVSHPCSGHGICGKCEVRLSGKVSNPNAIEIKHNKRLSCQAIILGEAIAAFDSNDTVMQIETGDNSTFDFPINSKGDVGAAIDIGTTTVVLKLFDLKSGKQIKTVACVNPQTEISADVMGRIEKAMNGSLNVLKELILGTIADLFKEAGVEINSIYSFVVTGNTAMLYLLCGINPESLSAAPFKADNLFGTEIELLGKKAYLPPCMNAFVGADITCALLAAEVLESPKILLLCDIGTNGEIALWKNGRLYVTSTAAGPAFEGAGISCGCSSVEGAVDKVWVENNAFGYSTVNSKPPVGICGSGLTDAVSAALEMGLIDETGAISEDIKICENVVISQGDIRAVQLAKSAIAAGIETVLELSCTLKSEIDVLYIAGGFGSHLNTESAVNIGLLPRELKDRVKVLGNAALKGATSVMLNSFEKQKLQKIAEKAELVSLGGNPKFNNYFVENMYF